MICPFCSGDLVWVSNAEIYDKPYGKSHMIWLCRNCNAYVGCHNNTKDPKGSVATKSIRRARMDAHAAFDPLWQKGLMTRKQAYQWLSSKFGHLIHIGGSDQHMCEDIIGWIKSEFGE